MTGPPEPAASSLVTNEQIKLTATYLNGVAIAIFAIGGLAPMVAIVTGATTSSTVPLSISVLTGICVTGSAALHLGARRYLRGLRP